MMDQDNHAFNNMQQVSPDQAIDGGAINYSAYSMDLAPNEQKMAAGVDEKLLNEAYELDPNVDKEKVSFRNYLDWLNPELLKLRSEDATSGIPKGKGKFSDNWQMLYYYIGDQADGMHGGDYQEMIDTAKDHFIIEGSG